MHWLAFRNCTTNAPRIVSSEYGLLAPQPVDIPSSSRGFFVAVGRRMRLRGPSTARGNRGPLSVGAAEEERRKSVHAVLRLRRGETLSFPRTCSSGRELSLPELFPDNILLDVSPKQPGWFCRGAPG